MTEIVSRSEVHHLTQEYQRTWKELLNLLLARIKASGRNAVTGVTVKVEGKDVYKSLPNKNPTLNNLQPEHIEKFKTALTNPSNLKGSVIVLMENKKVFEVKDGQVIKDDLQLILKAPKQMQEQQEPDIELHLDTQKLKEKGNIIANCARGILNSLRGDKEVIQASDGTCCYTSVNYIFSLRNDKVSVVSKETGQLVLNNDGFTDEASQKDIKLLQKVVQAAAVMNQNNVQQQQQLHQQNQPQFTLKMRQRAW